MFLVLNIYQFVYIFFFNDTATTEIYTLSLHDALPIYDALAIPIGDRALDFVTCSLALHHFSPDAAVSLLRELARRSEEHTSELQSRQYLVCRLLLEKKKKEAH